MTGVRTRMSGSLFAVARALAFVLLALVLCGAIFELAGYSSLLMFQSIAEGAFASPDGAAQQPRAGRCRCSSPPPASWSRSAAATSMSARRASSISARSAPPSRSTWLNGAPAFVVIPLRDPGRHGGGRCCGRAWPGLLRIRSGTDEVITTLMANFIAGLVLIYVTSGPLKDPSGTGQVTASRPIAALYRISNSAACRPPSSASSSSRAC